MLIKPFPNKGKTLLKEKLFMLEVNKNIILINTIGIIIKLVFKVALNSNLLVIATQITKDSITKNIFVIG